MPWLFIAIFLEGVISEPAHFFDTFKDSLMHHYLHGERRRLKGTSLDAVCNCCWRITRIVCVDKSWTPNDMVAFMRRTLLCDIDTRLRRYSDRGVAQFGLPAAIYPD